MLGKWMFCVLCSSFNGFQDVVLPDCLDANACSKVHDMMTGGGKAAAGPLTVAPTPMAAPRRFTASVLGAKAVSRSSSKVSAAFSWQCIFQFLTR